jgi:hypothetical protein
MTDLVFLKALRDKLKGGNIRSIHLNVLPGRFASRLDLGNLNFIKSGFAEKFLDMLFTQACFDFKISFDDIDLNGLPTEEQKRLGLLSKRLNSLKGIINLLVPSDLADIPFEKLIKFRNKNRQLITAFNQKLDNVQQKIINGYTMQEFIDSYNNVTSELSKVVFSLGFGVVSIPLAAYILILNPNATSPQYLKEIIGAVGILVGGGYALNKGLRDTKTKRYCKKYFTNLERIRY